MRCGITVIEVLVALVIGLLALGLFVMLLARHRENALRVQCKNNLKLIGDAFQQYHDSGGNLAHKRLPPSRIADGYATWAVLIAPYLTKENPLQQWSEQESYFAQDEEVRQARFLHYFCPSRPRTDTLSVAGDVNKTNTHQPGALGDYAAVAGDGSTDWASVNANGALVLADGIERKGERIVKWHSVTSLDKLKRGEAYTLLLGEKHVPAGQFGDAAVGDGSLYNGAHPASFSRIAGPGFPIAPTVYSPFNKNFGSYHNGICQFLNADTSVRWLTPEVSEFVLGELAKRGD